MKNFLQKSVRKIKQCFTNPRTRVLSIVVLFVVAGSLTLLLIHAAQPNQSVQPENSGNTVGSPATRCNGSVVNTSGGCVQFGGGGGASKPAATALTVVATDGVVGNALCLDNSAAGATACIQVNPANTSQARGGTYDIVQMKFVAATGWDTLSDVMAANQVTSKTCNGSSHTFYALGPLGTSYYGEEISGSSAAFGAITNTNACTSSGGGTVSGSRWATPAIYCSAAASASAVNSLTALIGAIAASKSEICVAPGDYTFTAGMNPVAVKANMKIIGQSPLQRPVFDSSALPKHNGSGGGLNTGVFVSGGSSATIANVVVQGAQTDNGGVKNKTCISCGNGIDGGDGVHIYNVRMTNNQETGFHWHHPGSSLHYILENSELSNNGNDGDSNWSAAGFKTTGAGLMQRNVVINNNGNGLWCDGNTPSTAVCHDGTWTVTDNYIAGNAGPGIHYEISFNVTGAKIQNNVVNCNNTQDKLYSGGISIYGAYVTVSGNIFDNRHTTATDCTNKRQGILVYTDTSPNRSPPAPDTNHVTVTNNTMNGDKVNCTLSGSNYGPGIVCTPNTP